MRKQPVRLEKKKENPLHKIPLSVVGFIIFVIVFLMLIAMAIQATSYYNQCLYLL